MAERRTVDLSWNVPQHVGKTNRTARPIVALARLPWPKALWVAFMPITVRTGPLTTMNGALPPVLALLPCRLNALLAHGAQDSHHHRQIHGQAPRHDGVDGDFLSRDGPLPHRFDPHKVSG